MSFARGITVRAQPSSGFACHVPGTLQHMHNVFNKAAQNEQGTRHWRGKLHVASSRDGTAAAAAARWPPQFNSWLHHSGWTLQGSMPAQRAPVRGPPSVAHQRNFSPVDVTDRLKSIQCVDYYP